MLKELLQHHIKEEEGEFFDSLGENFSDASLKAMAIEFHTRKEALLGVHEAVEDQHRR